MGQLFSFGGCLKCIHILQVKKVKGK